MDSHVAEDLTSALHVMSTKIEHLAREQQEANGLMRTLIDRLEANSQELFDLREKMAKQTK